MNEVVTNLKRVTCSYDEEMASTPEEREYYRSHPEVELPVTDKIAIAPISSTPTDREVMRQKLVEEGVL
jgi:hypothetical protein